MANKKSIKKDIRRACGEIAGECIFAESAFNVDTEKMDDIVVRLALFQEKTLQKVNVAFDRTPKSFETLREYRKARRAYFKSCFKALREEIHAYFTETVNEMNALVRNK